MPLRGTAALVAVLAAVLFSVSARAGGPFYVDDAASGTALQWENQTLKWCPDPGDLASSVPHDTAVQWITEALGKWTSVKLRNASNQLVDTTSVSTAMDAGCPVMNITVDNYLDYYNGDEGPTVVVFDETGEITAVFVGEENKDGVVGLSVPLASDSSGKFITKGIVIFNGLLLASDNTTLGSDLATKSSYYKATVLHELGHLLNLDHSQTNYEYVKDCELGSTCDNSTFIPTMYPELISTSQSDLNRDDEVTISWLYPTPVLGSQFCLITGRILDGDDRPLKGVHVTATRAEGTTTPLVEARSFVSGAMYPSCDGDSRYYLYGIVPGRAYKVWYEAIGEDFRGASDFEPLDYPPKGFDAGSILGPDDATTVSCSQGGETIEMQDVKIDTANPCAGTSTATTSSGSKTSCSLVRCGAAHPSSACIAMICILASAALIAGRFVAGRMLSGKAS
ncbi:MAG: hypothetical protein JXA24_07570 [Proteobacteria bacterium]|nr:hypothetical protein [Pseudomonadota bacterium]